MLACQDQICNAGQRSSFFFLNSRTGRRSGEPGKKLLGSRTECQKPHIYWGHARGEWIGWDACFRVRAGPSREAYGTRQERRPNTTVRTRSVEQTLCLLCGLWSDSLLYFRARWCSNILGIYNNSSSNSIIVLYDGNMKTERRQVAQSSDCFFFALLFVCDKPSAFHCC